MVTVMKTEEEKVNLGNGKFQILKVETLSNGNIRKTDSGFKEINGIRVAKVKKLNL